MRPKHLDLFSGIGGMALAANAAGFQTVAFSEIDTYANRILAERFPGIPNVGDIRTFCREAHEFSECADGCGEPFCEIHREHFHECACVSASEFIETHGEIDLLTGGFPCQPFSLIGKRKGEDDSRHLWGEMLRVIQVVQPTWVVGENVFGIVNMGLESLCADLETCDYEVQPFVIPSCAVYAPHRRERVVVVAHRIGARLEGHSRNVDTWQGGAE